MDLNTRDLATFGPVIPVIVIHRVEDAVPVAQALVAGGVRVLEVTLRTPVALEAIKRIRDFVPEAVVGAGTVRSVEDARAAKLAGCQFAVSPGYLPEIGDECFDIDLPLLPGVSTATEVLSAWTEGYDFLKLFPASAVGGTALLKALAGPFPDVAFCPTGGITAETAPEYLALPNVLACGGTWLVPEAVVRAGDWARITQLAADTRKLRAV